MNNFLKKIERAGNRLPHPTALFFLCCIGIVIISIIASGLGLQAISPVTEEIILAKSIFSEEGLHFFLGSAVKNFVTFAPVGTVLVAVLGLGIADHSGLLPAILTRFVQKTPDSLLTSSIILCGILSSLAADSGYVILIPLAGIIFMRAGKHPIAGIAAAFAGVSAGFSANIIIGPIDAILSGISQEAAQIVSPNYTVNIASNYYFLLASTFLITLIASAICHFFTRAQTKHLPFKNTAEDYDYSNSSAGLRAAFITSIIFVGLILWGALPEDGVLRGEDGSLTSSPLSRGVVVIIALWAAINGIAFGLASGKYTRVQDCIEGMEQHIATLAGYLVLMFFAAQFVHLFSWSQLGIIFAISGANVLKALELPLPLLLISFVFLAALINLLIGSASAKWALLAPIFVPMLLLLGITPEATQIAFRIGDSTTNIITPLMPYFGVVIAFMQHYNKDIGAGTIMALMLPYSLALLAGWTLLLAIWLLADLPLGPGANAFITSPDTSFGNEPRATSYNH